MIWGEVASGTFLVVYGLGFAALARLLAARDGYLARASESRWRSMRFLDRRVRRGRITKEEWIERDRARQRQLYTWVGVPGGLVCAAGGLSMVVHGLVS